MSDPGDIQRQMRLPSAPIIRDALDLTGWTIRDLWVAAVAIGGSLSYHDIDQLASGQRIATPSEHDILAAAFNDHLTGQGRDHPVRYWRQLSQPPTTG